MTTASQSGRRIDASPDRDNRIPARLVRSGTTLGGIAQGERRDGPLLANTPATRRAGELRVIVLTRRSRFDSWCPPPARHTEYAAPALSPARLSVPSRGRSVRNTPAFPRQAAHLSLARIFAGRRTRVIDGAGDLGSIPSVLHRPELYRAIATHAGVAAPARLMGDVAQE